MDVQAKAHRSTVFTTLTDSVMYVFYLANAKSFSQMIASDAGVLEEDAVCAELVG